MVKARTQPHLRTALLASALAGACAIGFFLIWLSQPSNESLCASIRKLRREGKTEVAWKTTLELLAQDPSDAASWKLIGDMAEETNHSDIALDSFQKLIELNPSQQAVYWVRIASLQMSQNQGEAAQTALSNALLHAPNSADAVRLKVQLDGVLGRSSSLASGLLRLIQLRAFTQDDLLVLASSDPFVADEKRLAALRQTDPDNPQLLLPLARVALNENRVDDAKQFLQELTLKLPGHWEAHGMLGQILASEDNDEFLKWQQTLAPEADANSRIWLARGLWLERQGETQPAARCFREAIELEPELLTAVSHLGQCVRLNGEQEIADLFSVRASLLLKTRDLATRIDEQKQLQWAPELISSLEKLGRYWEAWAWSTVLAQSNPMDFSWKQTAQRLEKRLTQTLPRTDPAALPAQHLDWNKVALPNWSAYSHKTPSATAASSESSIQFRDDASMMGLNFSYRNKTSSAESGNLIYESTGGGVAVIDIDGDSWPDLFFVQGGSLLEPTISPVSDTLFRNQRGTRFTNVTMQAAVNENSYGQGVAAGDINNDGFPDLYVANIGENRLLMNNGDGTFSQAVSEVLATEPRWTISTAIADVNRDGQPELIDVNYCEGKALTTVCVTDQQKPRACRPTIFDPAPDIQFTNNGDGSFTESQLTSETQTAGGRGMGIVVADFDEDTWADLFVANDQSPNHLLLNDSRDSGRPATFREEGLLRGVGLDRDGFALAFMGIAHGDVNLDGRLDLFVTTFSQETPTLFLSQPGGQFSDSTREAGLRAPCFSTLGFGTQFLDADSDGFLDLLIMNGHIDQFTDSGQDYQMRPQCFRGLPNSKFQELPLATAGEFFNKPRLGRALALLDWNNDAQLDFVATDLEQPVALGTNTSQAKGNTARLRCVGVLSSRDAVGTTASFTATDGSVRIQGVTAGDGYEACSERRLCFATGDQDHADTVTIAWVSGIKSEFHDLQCGSQLIVIEGRPTAYAIPL